MEARHLTAAIALAILWTLEFIIPLFRNRGKRVSHNAANFGLALLNAVLSFGLSFALLGATELARAAEFGLLHVAPLPAWLHLVLALLLMDLWQYWWHRLNHLLPFLWRFHAVHHADAELDVSSGVRFHTIEIALSFLARLLVLPALGLTMVELLLYEAIALPVILFHHANIRLPGTLDRILRTVIVTPGMHVIHHSRLQPETDSNFSSCLSLWDRLFRSFRLREHPAEIQPGLDHWERDQWRSLIGMLVAPFRLPGAGRKPAEHRAARSRRQ